LVGRPEGRSSIKSNTLATSGGCGKNGVMGPIASPDFDALLAHLTDPVERLLVCSRAAIVSEAAAGR
jgi:hypothetical protein